jgi:hypothetical protein
LDEYACVRLSSRPGEPQGGFGKRLTEFWSHFLRAHPEAYRQVYAESTRFEPAGDRLIRQYLVGLGVLNVLESELSKGGIEHESIDRDELFSKFDAVAPEWFQIPH